MDHTSQMGRLADEHLVAGADIGALEQQHVRLQAQQSLDHHVAAMGQRSWIVVEAASMRRVGADRRTSSGEEAGKPREGSSLRAVSVNHVGTRDLQA